MGNDDCLEDKREDYQNYCVLESEAIRWMFVCYTGKWQLNKHIKDASDFHKHIQIVCP